jgi:hypothetical protein
LLLLLLLLPCVYVIATGNGAMARMGEVITVEPRLPLDGVWLGSSRQAGCL